MFSCWRSHGWQNWVVTASLGGAPALAPPRWVRLPGKTSREPAGAIALTAPVSNHGGRAASHRWLPGISSVAPFASVNGSSDQMALTPHGGRGIGWR